MIDPDFQVRVNELADAWQVAALHKAVTPALRGMTATAFAILTMLRTASHLLTPV
jgi:hypothetical protein